ncbi:MAG TPA: sugar porter family MFS transporter [Verrucomicrobiota bacterium]|nr:sugar porter family MFS transporter [Verrucomicrobiota bacterium]
MTNPSSDDSAGDPVFLVIICVVAALGGLLFGFDTAVISGTVGFFEKEFGLSAVMKGWVTGSALVGCFFGALGAGALSDRVGRKRVMLLAAAFFTVSAVWCGLAGDATQLVLARLVGGLGIGIASLVSPLYIAEVSPAARRGLLVALQQLAIVLGILAAFYSNSLLLQTDLAAAAKWRWMFAVGAFPAVVFLASILIVPESPRWLCKQGRETEASTIIVRLSGPEAARAELAEIRDALAQEGGAWRELLLPGVRRALWVGLILAVLTQVTGINAIMYYAPDIFKQAGSEATTAYNDTVWVGLTNLVFTVVSMAVVDRLGRKPLLLIGATCMGAALAWVGYAFHHSMGGIGLLVGVLAYVGSFALSMGVVGWVVISEIYPTRIRGRAMAVATGGVWAACYVVAQTFPVLVERIGTGTTFWVYGVFCIVAIAFVALFVPETKGRTLEEIERSWRRV